ncbi:MAG: methyltransferase [Halioglobus sp.]
MSQRKTPTSRRFRGVTMPTSTHPEIRKVRRQGHTTTIHGNKLWKSSCLLIDYLHQNPPEHTARVIDVGCGWGIAGIWCARHLDSKVTSVDADAGVFPFLDATASINHVTTQTLKARFEELTVKQLAKYDMLIAADICFWDELVTPVANLVNRAVRAGVKHILIADPERGTFFDMAERCVDRHYAEILPWETVTPIKARGAIMVLENA